MVGFPLSHSRSPEIWQVIFKNLGISNISYHLFEVKDVTQILHVLSQPDVVGVNVTIPYKQKVIPLLNELTSQAEGTGAVNTIVKSANGKLIGHNTDVEGFKESLKNFLGSETIEQAFILGTGGSALAVSLALKSLAVDHYFISRKPGGDKVLTYDDINTPITEFPKLIVNCTPLGMYPNVSTFPPIDFQKIKAKSYCFDLVYNPETTIFLQKCKMRGAFVRNGMEMLHLQAIKAWDFLSKHIP